MTQADQVRFETRRSDAAAVVNRHRISLFIFGSVALSVLLLSGKLFETNNSGWYSVKQAAMTGKMTAYTSPGMFAQGFGDVWKYKAADALHFGEDLDPITVRFNDGASATVVVNARVELPADPDKLLAIHQRFRSYESLLADSVKPIVSESVLLTAAMMSAEESYTTKRAEFSQLAHDQVVNGVLLTEAETVKSKDPRTGDLSSHQIVSVQLDKNGKAERKDSVLNQYGIRITQFLVKEIDYSPEVDEMISAKQTALQETVSAKANAERAVQDRITAEEVGRKNVTLAKYEQEVSKQKAVTQAEQELEVAKLRRAAAEMEKQSLIAKGEGEGTYKRLVMQADGALTQKLAAYVETQKFWADAFSKSQHPLVPSVVMGGSHSNTNAAQSMLDLISIKAARELAINPNAK